MAYNMEIIPMVTMGVCITCVSGLFEENTGTRNKWQVTMKGGSVGLCKRCFIRWTEIPFSKVSILICGPVKEGGSRDLAVLVSVPSPVCPSQWDQSNPLNIIGLTKKSVWFFCKIKGIFFIFISNSIDLDILSMSALPLLLASSG